MDSIRGIIDKILKREDDRIFALVRYEKDGKLARAKISGRVYEGLSEGDIVAARGRWRTSEYRGKREDILNFWHIRPGSPKLPQLVEAHLASAFNEEEHGISWNAIRRLVLRYSDETLAVIDRDPSLLVRLSSDPERYGQAILETHKRRSGGRRASSILNDAGLTEGQIARILDAFKDQALDVLSSNPYEAASVPEAGGFPVADKVGRRMGIGTTDRRRLDAALEHAIRMEMDRGSTCASLKDLMLAIKDSIGLTLADISEFTQTVGLSAPRIVCDLVDGEIRASLGSVARQEAQIANRTINLLKRPSRDETRVRQKAGEIFSRMELPFDEVQQRAVIEAARHGLFILTGGPGTGKTAVTKAIADLCEALGDSPVYLAAPTGKASSRLEESTGRDAQTGHRLLRAQPDPRYGGSTFQVNSGNPLPSGSVVIFDEASMGDVELAAAILEALPEDGRLIFVGDKNQLPSVGAGKVLADLLQAQKDGRFIVPSVELSKVYRQGSNSKIALDAMKIRDGITPSVSQAPEGGVAFIDSDPRMITKKITDLVKNVFSQPVLLNGPDKPPTKLDLMRDLIVLCPQAPGPAGTHEINNALSKALNPDGESIPGVKRSPGEDERIPLPRVGDRVMLSGENDEAHGVSNGDTGRIVGVQRREGKRGGPNFIVVEFDHGKVVEYPASYWRKLLLAYAMTIHKSQGSQAPVVLMPLTLAHERMLDRTLLYTGWTRAEKLVIGIGEHEAFSLAVDSQRLPQRETRTRHLIEKICEEHKLAPKGAPVPAMLRDATNNFIASKDEKPAFKTPPPAAAAKPCPSSFRKPAPAPGPVVFSSPFDSPFEPALEPSKASPVSSPSKGPDTHKEAGATKAPTQRKAEPFLASPFAF